MTPRIIPSSLHDLELVVEACTLRDKRGDEIPNPLATQAGFVQLRWCRPLRAELAVTAEWPTAEWPTAEWPTAEGER